MNMSSEIQYVEGDATVPTSSGPTIIAHICNDLGKWGRGFVLVVSGRWKQPEIEYRRWYGQTSFVLGKIQVVQVAPALWVSNMIAQHGVRSSARNPLPIRYGALEQCLTALAVTAETKSAEVHMPRIGCGLAGGEWSRVEPLIQKTLVAKSISVTVYDFN